MPINIVVGFLEMNVGEISLAKNEHGWLRVVRMVLVAGFTFLAGYWAFSRRQGK